MKTKANKAEQTGERIAFRGGTARQPTTGNVSHAAPGIELQDARSVTAHPSTLQNSIDSSPRQAAQAKQLSAVFGAPEQREEEEDGLQLVAAPTAAQYYAGEEETPPPRRFDAVQRQGTDEYGPLQGKLDSGQAVVQSQTGMGDGENRTGMPDRLKAGIERLSGTDLSDVRVQTDSPKPAQLNAHAYAQGDEIHLGPQQEKHLPHEAWHLVQQRQGRVRPTVQMAGVQINDEEGLEREADLMGEKAVRAEAGRKKKDQTPVTLTPVTLAYEVAHRVQQTGSVQRSALEVVQDEDVSPSAFLDDDVEKAERRVREYQASPEYRVGSVLTNKYSRNEVRQRIASLEKQTANLEFHAKKGTSKVTWDQVNTNQATLAELRAYSDAAGQEGIDLGGLATSNKTLQQDFARLNAALTSAQKLAGLNPADAMKGSAPVNPVDHTKPLSKDAQMGQRVGEQLVVGMTGGDRTTGKDENLAELRTLTNSSITAYNFAVGKVKSSEGRVKQHSAGLKAASASLTAFDLRDKGEEIRTKLQDAQAKAAEINSAVSTVTGLIVSCVGVTGGLSAALAGNVAAEPSVKPLQEFLGEKASEVVLSTVNDLISAALVHTSGIGKRIKDLTGALQGNELAEQRARKEKEGANVERAAAALKAAVTEYKTAVADVDAKKRTMRTALSDYGARLDRLSEEKGTGSGDRFKIVAKVMGEADAFLGQAGLVWKRVKSYQSSSAEAREKRNSINTGVSPDPLAGVTGSAANKWALPAAGLKYGLAAWSVRVLTDSKGRTIYLVECENIHLHYSGQINESNQTPAEAVEKIANDVKRAGSMAYGMRNQLAAVLGLNLAGVKPEFV